MLRLGRGLFLLLAGGLVVLVLATLGSLPPVVASHFDSSGTPNGWSTRTGYAALLIVVGALLPLGVVATVGALTRSGPERLNIPSRNFWRRPEHAAEACAGSGRTSGGSLASWRGRPWPFTRWCFGRTRFNRPA